MRSASKGSARVVRCAPGRARQCGMRCAAAHRVRNLRDGRCAGRTHRGDRECCGPRPCAANWQIMTGQSETGTGAPAMPAAKSAASRRRAAFIELDAVSKTFSTRDRSSTLAVDGVDLDIGGERVRLAAGPERLRAKARCSRSSPGLIQPTSGEARIEGKPVLAPYTNTGIVFQSDSVAGLAYRARQCPYPVRKCAA